MGFSCWGALEEGQEALKTLRLYSSAGAESGLESLGVGASVENAHALVGIVPRSRRGIAKAPTEAKEATQTRWLLQKLGSLSQALTAEDMFSSALAFHGGRWPWLKTYRVLSPKTLSV